MRLTLTMFVTLDGVCQGPGAPTEDPSGGFEHGGWLVPYFEDDIGHVIDGWVAQADALLLGRRTYEIFAGSWGKVTDLDDPIAGPFNRLPKYVASRTLDEVSWQGSQLLGEDVAAEVAELKRRPGRELQVHGSIGLAQTLIREGLVDEYRLITFPVVLGQGKRLFPDAAKPAALNVEHVKTSSKGVSIDVYTVAGEPTYGSIEVGDEELRR